MCVVWDAAFSSARKMTKKSMMSQKQKERDSETPSPFFLHGAEYTKHSPKLRLLCANSPKPSSIPILGKRVLSKMCRFVSAKATSRRRVFRQHRLLSPVFYIELIQVQGTLILSFRESAFVWWGAGEGPRPEAGARGGAPPVRARVSTGHRVRPRPVTAVGRRWRGWVHPSRLLHGAPTRLRGFSRG